MLFVVIVVVVVNVGGGGGVVDVDVVCCCCCCFVVVNVAVVNDVALNLNQNLKEISTNQIKKPAIKIITLIYTRVTLSLRLRSKFTTLNFINISSVDNEISPFSCIHKVYDLNCLFRI